MHLEKKTKKTKKLKTSKMVPACILDQKTFAPALNINM